MARYEKVFTLTPMLYTEGSPVIIEAGALQKDNVNGNIIAQLKFKSVSAKVIKALTVKIVALDVSGNPIGEKIEHQYLDLTVQRNECFGSKEPIILSDNTTRAFSVFVTKIVFDDNTNMVLKKSEWSALPEQNIIDLDSVEQKYFYNRYWFKSPKRALKYKDLWLCSCGTINHNGEEKCFHCVNECNKMLRIDYEELKCEAHYNNACDLLSRKSTSSVNSAINEFNKIIDYKDASDKIIECKKEIEEIEANREKLRIAAEELEKRRKKVIAIISCIVCVCIVFGIILKVSIIPSVKYRSAVKMMNNSEYTESIEKFKSLGVYKDCEDKINECNYLYAIELMNKCKYTDAIATFETLSSYKDCEDKVKECNYLYAVELMNKCKYTDAITTFKTLSSYKDCENKIKECNYLYAIDLLSKKDYCNSIKYFKYCSGYKDSDQKSKNLELKIIKKQKWEI